MRRFVIGDIHGRHKALLQVLKRSGFDKDKDLLIVLGDVADGGYNTYQVVEELLKIKNLVYLIGNHDEWFMNHIKTGWAEEIRKMTKEAFKKEFKKGLEFGKGKDYAYFYAKAQFKPTLKNTKTDNELWIELVQGKENEKERW